MYFVSPQIDGWVRFGSWACASARFEIVHQNHLIISPTVRKVSLC